MAKHISRSKLIEDYQYHLSEWARILGELNTLGPQYSEDGPVKTVLRNRVTQEQQRANEILKKLEDV